MVRSFKSLSIIALVAFAVLTLIAASPKEPDPAYVQSFEKWKAEQTADLKENWVPLAGLFWLKPGTNAFGSDRSSPIVFPKGPAHAGEFDLNGTEVTLKLLPEVKATIDGKPITTTRLDPDTSGHASTVELGSLRFLVIVRGERVGIRLRDNDTGRAHTFKGMVFYPLDMSYRVTAAWSPSDGTKKLEVPNVLGDVSAVKTPGIATFTVNGQSLQLTALSGDEKKGLFFVFNDPTLKKDTYPGGRFLDTGPVVDGHVILDFNRAYNPPCAVTPYATCPLAPKENRLTVEIPAGEKFDRSAHDHH